MPALKIDQKCTSRPSQVPFLSLKSGRNRKVGAFWFSGRYKIRDIIRDQKLAGRILIFGKQAQIQFSPEYMSSVTGNRLLETTSLRSDNRVNFIYSTDGNFSAGKT